MTAQTWRGLIGEATQVLGSAQEAQWLAEEASGCTRAELAASLDDPVPARMHGALFSMLGRRVAGEPLQYTLGHWGFRSLDLMVDRRVLIPRPETEQVVEVALGVARDLDGAPREPLVVADLGTGSGAIALSLAVELGARTEVWATDISSEALEVVSANLAGLAGFAATRVRLVHGSWFGALVPELEGRLDLVVSNPPYVADRESLPAEVERWEPAGALRSGPTGLECLAAILSAAPRWLAPGGAVVLELAPHQRGHVAELAGDAGFARVAFHQDLAGRDRVMVARDPRG